MFSKGWIVVTILVIFLGNSVHAQDTEVIQKGTEKVDCKSGTAFLKEVVRKLGTDGRACHQADGKTYCLSRTDKYPKAITVDDISEGDRIRFIKGVYLCAETDGELGDCAPSSAGDWDCDDDTCWCDGEESCAVLASSACENGMCGDCGDHECCCDFPSGD